MKSINDVNTIIWDARAPEEFNGTKVTASRNGHVPGAISLDWMHMKDLNNNSKLRNLDEIKSMLAGLGITNNVKVITDENQNAIYFSRSIIPFKRNDASINYFKHVGVYAFRKSFLTKFSSLKIGDLETAEKIEALRMVENGVAIKMIESDEKFIGIDTLEDLEMARKMINEKGSI